MPSKEEDEGGGRRKRLLKFPGQRDKEVALVNGWCLRGVFPKG